MTIIRVNTLKILLEKILGDNKKFVSYLKMYFYIYITFKKKISNLN